MSYECFELDDDIMGGRSVATAEVIIDCAFMPDRPPCPRCGRRDWLYREEVSICITFDGAQKPVLYLDSHPEKSDDLTHIYLGCTHCDDALYNLTADEEVIATIKLWFFRQIDMVAVVKDWVGRISGE